MKTSNSRSLNPAVQLGLTLAVLTTPVIAEAHVGLAQTSGFTAGFAHPLTGLDHALVMVAVGLCAVQRDIRALWLLPATFLLVLALGGIVGAMGVLVPFVEHGIVLSMLVTGLLAAGVFRPPLGVVAACVGGFAVCHGLVHGAEMPAGVSGLGYGAGFLLGAAALHAFGVTIALIAGALYRSMWTTAKRPNGVISSMLASSRP